MPTNTSQLVEVPQSHEGRRALAVKPIKEKSDFRIHAVTYLAVNAMVVVIWLVTGRVSFWPIFPIVGWGIGLLLHGYTVYRSTVITEEQIERETARLGG